MTHEHYLQTVLTTIKPWGAVSGFNVYEYTQHSHAMKTASESPRAKFHFDPSPVQIYVSEERQKFYHFITTLMAIVGGGVLRHGDRGRVRAQRDGHDQEGQPGEAGVILIQFRRGDEEYEWMRGRGDGERAVSSKKESRAARVDKKATNESIS